MPEVVGKLIVPRLTGAPSSPAVGQIYQDINNVMWVFSSTSVWRPLNAMYISSSAMLAALTPVDGMEVYFQDTTMAANGVIWYLRYRSASPSAYKWEFIGGSPIVANSVTNEGSAGGVAYHATPVLTIPLTGDYLLGFSMDTYGSPNQAGLQVWWGAQLGDGTTLFGDRFSSEHRFVAGSGNPSHLMFHSNQDELKTGLVASSVVKLKAQVVNWDYASRFRTISALPVRVS